MAVKASDSVTLVVLPAPTYVRLYYLKQASTLNPPAKPTTNPPPQPWSTAEPTYMAGSTDTLYTVMITAYGENAFEYGPVQKSSSFEAAKAAYNKAAASTAALAGAITSITTEYSVGPSDVVAPETGWSTAQPVKTPGSFIWIRNVIVYGDNNTVTTSAAVLTGNTGVSVESITPYYAGFSTEWAGEEGASESILKMGGEEVARTLVTNPLGWTPRSGYTSIVSQTEEGTTLELGNAASATFLGTFKVVSTTDVFAPVYASVRVRNDGPAPISMKLAFYRSTSYSPGGYTTIPVGSAATLTIDADVFPEGSNTSTFRLVAGSGNTVGTKFTILPNSLWASIGQPLSGGFTGSTQPYPELVEGFLPSTPVVDVNEPTATNQGYVGTGVFVGDHVSTTQDYQYLLSSDSPDQRLYLVDKSTPYFMNMGTPMILYRENSSPFYAVKMFEEGNPASRFGKHHTANQATNWLGAFRAVVYDRVLSETEMNLVLDYLLTGGYLEAPGTPIPTWSKTEPPVVEGRTLFRTELVVMSNGQYSYTPITPVASYEAASQAVYLANLVDEAAKNRIYFGEEPPPFEDWVENQIWISTTEEGQMTSIYRVVDHTNPASGWATYTMMAGMFIVPGEPDEDGVIRPTIIDQNGLTVGYIDVHAISADSIQAESLTGEKFIAGSLTRNLLDEETGEIISDADDIRHRVIIQETGILITEANYVEGQATATSAVDLSSSRISFYTSGKEQTYIDGPRQLMSIKDAYIRNSIQIGEHLIQSLATTGSGQTIFRYVGQQSPD